MMCGFVIVRNEDGLFVGLPARHPHSSYTNSLRKARVFTTRSAAQQDACGNETIMAIGRLLEGGWL